MRWLLILLIFLPVYLFRLNRVQPLQVSDGAEIRLTGRISQQPYLKNSKQIIRVSQFLVITGRFPEYFYGQKLEIVGKITKKVINKFKTDFVLSYPTIRVLDEEENLINQTEIVGRLLAFRRRLENLFSSFLPEPQSSLLSGILLGSKSQMPENFLKELRGTGTIHIVVASGYNITVVAGFLMSALGRFVGRKKALILAFGGIFAYTLMAGAEPPVVRAAIMGGLTYLAQFLGREKDAIFALVFTAIVMLLISPLILFDIGFQLSFLATAGILLAGPALGQGRVFELPGVGENLRTTLAAQAGVLPILLANFGQISFLSPLINALVLPVVPLIMGLGAVVGGLGLIWQPLAQTVAWFAWVPLTYFVKVIEWFGSLSFASLTVGKISFWWVVGYYLVLTIWIIKSQKSPAERDPASRGKVKS